MSDNSHMTKENTSAKRILSDDIHDYIRVRGANEHNLMHVDVKIPRETLKIGEQRVMQGREFRKSDAHYRTIKLEFDNPEAGS